MDPRSTAYNPPSSPMDVVPPHAQRYPPSHSLPVAGTSSPMPQQHQYAQSSDSSPPPHWEAIETTPPGSSKKVRAKPATDRSPGTTLIPMNRVETIGSAGGANGVLSKEAVYVLSVATEEFIKKLTTVSYIRADIEKRAITSYGDIAETVESFPDFQFLKDTIPRPMPLFMALATRQTLEQQRELDLDKVAEETSLRMQNEKLEDTFSDERPSIYQQVLDEIEREKAKLSNANGSTASKSKASKGKSKVNTSVAGEGASHTPSLRSERLKNKRAKLEQGTIDAAEAPHPSSRGDLLPNAGEQPAAHVSTYAANDESISMRSKSKSRSSKAANPSNESNAKQSISVSPAPSTSGHGQSASGYKIKIKPRQTSSQNVPTVNSRNQGVENVSSSLAYASLYATPTTAAINTGEGSTTPPVAKRPRLSLHTGESPSQQNGSATTPPENGANSTKKGENGTTSEKTTKSSASKMADRSKQNSSKNAPHAAPVPDDGDAVASPSSRVHASLPAPPSASVQNNRCDAPSAEAEVSGMDSPLSPPADEDSARTNGFMHDESVVSHDSCRALSPSATIPGRTIYSHSHQ